MINNANKILFQLVTKLKDYGIDVKVSGDYEYSKDYTSLDFVEKIDELDFSQHDKPFKDEIAKLKKNLEKAEKKTGEKLKQTNEEPSMYTFNIRKIDGEEYIRYSDYKWYRKGKENRIRELEEIIKDDSYKATKDIISENIELRKQVDELKSELSVKENLLKIKNEIRKENDSGFEYELPNFKTINGIIYVSGREHYKLIDNYTELKCKYRVLMKQHEELAKISGQIAERLLVYCNHNSEEDS